MATPSGQISFADLSVEILQAGSTSQRSLNDAGVRLGYGATSQVSISQLKKAWGCTITEGSFSDKFGSQYGFDAFFYSYGSTNDSTITGTTSLVASKSSGGGTSTQFWGGSGVYETGFRATDVGRIAIAGVSYAFGASNNDGSGVPDEISISSGLYDGVGTSTLGIKWN